MLETIRVRESRMPFLDRHLARLRSALEAGGNPAPAAGLEERLRAFAPAGQLVVRLVVDTAGEHVTTRSVPGLGPADVVVSTVPHERYPHKTTARTVFDRAAADAAARGAAEAILLTPEGFVAEGCISSLFFWSGAMLCTPALELKILPGVGRARILDLARASDVAVEQGRFRAAELRSAAAFLVNAVRGVTELRSVDGEQMPSDSRTAALAVAFWP